MKDNVMFIDINKKGSTIVTCDNCGKGFKVIHARLRTLNKTLCCSRECAAELKKSLKKPNASCYVCKKKFSVKPSKLQHMKNPDKITCSIECSKVMRSEIMSGEGNHQFGLKGELNSSHKSDVHITHCGYLKVRNNHHPFTSYDGYVFFHRIVMEEFLKNTNQYEYLTEVNGNYYLSKDYVVHHIDGNKLNNQLHNLTIETLGNHSRHHSSERIMPRDENSRFIKGEIKEGKLTKYNRLDAGQDVHSNEDVIIPANDSLLIGTGLFINIPLQHVGLLWSRSGLSVKHKIEVGAGCIDSGYNGEIKVHLYNNSDTNFSIKKGDRVAQLLTIPINPEAYEKVDEFIETERGTGGFGSTGR